MTDLDEKAEYIAMRFHQNYERLAPNFGYETRKETAVPWRDVLPSNKNLMIATAKALLQEGTI